MIRPEISIYILYIENTWKFYGNRCVGGMEWNKVGLFIRPRCTPVSLAHWPPRALHSIVCYTFRCYDDAWLLTKRVTTVICNGPNVSYEDIIVLHGYCFFLYSVTRFLDDETSNRFIRKNNFTFIATGVLSTAYTTS